jgi:hypothetical protein
MMPKQRISAQKVSKPEVAPRFDFKVKTIQAIRLADGEIRFDETGEFNCGSPRDAYNVADRLQREFDDDCDPCRTYVFKGNDPVPVHAGLERSTFRYG